ncbi:HNH endonuclease [Paenibacillus lactis]|uniref:HNH endonuclease n=1 Tax=Paenibacillus lactis TaxID=228574 RepID=UPI003D75E765
MDDKYQYIDGISYKKCTDCNEWLIKSLDNFYQNKSNKVDGLTPQCKSCTKKRTSKWRQENIEKHRQHIKKYRSTEKGNQAKNRLDQIYRSSGKYRDWCRNNKELIKKYQENRVERKTHQITENEWIACKEYFGNSCAYCGMDYFEQIERFNKDFSREHVEDEGANDLSNCVPACTSCNSRKWKHDMLNWFNRQKYFTEEKLEKILLWISADHKKHLSN